MAKVQLTRPFFLSPNRDIIRSNKALFGERKKGVVKTEITGAFEVASVYSAEIEIPNLETQRGAVEET